VGTDMVGTGGDMRQGKEDKQRASVHAMQVEPKIDQ
jgi:hypothetical protein